MPLTPRPLVAKVLVTSMRRWSQGCLNAARLGNSKYFEDLENFVFEVKTTIYKERIGTFWNFAQFSRVFSKQAPIFIPRSAVDLDSPGKADTADEARQSLNRSWTQWSREKWDFIGVKPWFQHLSRLQFSTFLWMFMSNVLMLVLKLFKREPTRHTLETFFCLKFFSERSASIHTYTLLTLYVT